jgi:hypothetical protein
MDRRFNTKMNENIDELLSQTWSNSLTRSQFEELFAVCGTVKNLEIHHIRSVKKCWSENSCIC